MIINPMNIITFFLPLKVKPYPNIFDSGENWVTAHNANKGTVTLSIILLVKNRRIIDRESHYYTI